MLHPRAEREESSGWKEEALQSGVQGDGGAGGHPVLSMKSQCTMLPSTPLAAAEQSMRQITPTYPERIVAEHTAALAGGTGALTLRHHETRGRRDGGREANDIARQALVASVNF